MTNPNSTIRKLAEITDAALFERLATSVLRLDNPHLYGNLSHPGVNPDGKTVKAPLDGIGWIRDANGDRVITVAHSTCEQSDIKKKWLHDSSTVIPRNKGGKPTAPDGDLHKAIQEISGFRSGHSALRATVALTSNREPDAESVVAAQNLASHSNIDLDIWSASRIANCLDNTPDGQWIRRTYLGDSVEIVSGELLRSCTQRRLEEYAYQLNPTELVDRNNLVEHSSGHMLLVGSSGVGKTTIALQVLKRHSEMGGAGLVIPHETVASATSLAEAIDIELRKLEPCLQPDAGHQALSLATESIPFVVVIEDVNASNDPSRTLNKLFGWALSSNHENNGKAISKWRLVCPIWPRHIDSLGQKLDEKMRPMLHYVDVYTDEQAMDAVSRKSSAAGCKLLPAEITSIAKALGNDPLLIALCDFSASIESANIVERYVDKEIAQVASISSDLHQSELMEALDSLIQCMLRHRRLNPSLAEIKEWLFQEPEKIRALQLIFKAGSVVRLVHRNGQDILTPRHDRVLLTLTSRIMAHDLLNGFLNESYLADPFFSESVGAAILSTPLDSDRHKWIMQTNPLALFYALHHSTKSNSLIRTTVIQLITDLLSNKEFHSRKFRTIRFHALHILGETDAPEMLAITDLFPTEDRYDSWLRARFRNGDLDAGLKLLTMFEFGLTVQGQEELIKHVIARFGTKLIDALIKLLNAADIDKRTKKGCLYLSGYLGDSTLAPAILSSWNFDDPMERNLEAYLWASARCFENESENTLKMVCDAWACLPDETDDNHPHLSKNNFAAYGLSWEFRRHVPHSAIPYLVQRANSDEQLKWPITYMLRDIDHPDAVEHIARFLAERNRNRQPDTYDHSRHALLDGWGRQQREQGIQMSATSKRRLLELALDSESDLWVRKAAFQVWEVSKSREDIDDIRNIKQSNDFYEAAIWARARRGDKAVIPELIELIPANPAYWWQAGRFLWSAELTEALHKNIHDLAVTQKLSANDEDYTELILSERLMEIDQPSAERILTQEWVSLKSSPHFVQTALYFATPQLTQLAKEAISQAKEPAALLEHVTMHMGWRTKGRSGITRFEQVKLLCDYVDLLSEYDIYTLWEICNERGWIDFRKLHLDKQLAQSENFGKRIGNTVDFSDLDQAIDGKVVHITSFWIENHMRDGKTLPELMDGLFDWLGKHQTIIALKVVAEIFYGSARRVDLERLQRFTKSWIGAEELIEDLAFSIRRRTLN